MNERDTTLEEHSDLSRRLLIVLEDFIDEIGHRGCTAHFEKVLTKGYDLEGRPLGQMPERFIEDYLIFPVLETLGHTILPRPVQYAPRWARRRGIPDFALTTVPVSIAKQKDIRLFGESKPPNKLQDAQDDVETYLKKDLDFHAITLFTDGFDWELWIRPRNRELTERYAHYVIASLHEPLNTVKARNLDQKPYHKHYARGQIDIESFSDLTKQRVLNIIESEFGIQNDWE